MNTKIKIGCTSFLLPGNESWNILTETNSVKFSEYGDWRTPLVKRKQDEYLCLVLFVPDLFYGFTETKPDNKKFLLLIKLLLKTINDNINRSASPTIIAVSAWKSDSLIREIAGNAEFKEVTKLLIDGLNKIKSKNSNLHILDLDTQFAISGFVNVFDKRNWYLAHCRLSSVGLDILAKSLAKIIIRIKKPAKKVLVLDCDNTLWGGVIGEDGISNLALGEDGMGLMFVDFQKVVKKLISEGILIVLCSKNNEKDVWDVFKKHQGMILKKNDISAYKINWKDKAQNLLELSSELNLDLNSFVFWDDNPIERDKVKKSIPEVYTVNVPKDVSEWADLLSSLDSLAKFNITNEDRKKIKQYKMRAKFNIDAKLQADENTFLKSIKLKAKKIQVNQTTVKRASQLSMKVNQLNLRTIRYTENQINQIKSDKQKNIFLVNLKDIYGDHGIVALVCLNKIDQKTIFIENFLMSCRVIGRHLEAWMFNQIVKYAKAKNYEYIFAEYIPTLKNLMAKNCLNNYSFNKYQIYTKKKPIKMNLKKYKKKSNLYIAETKKIKIPHTEVYE